MKHVTINEIKQLLRGSGYIDQIDEKTVERINGKTGSHRIEQIDDELTKQLTKSLSFHYPLLVTKSVETRSNNNICTHYVSWLVEEHPHCVFSIHIYKLDNQLNGTLRIYRRMGYHDEFRSIPIPYLYQKNPELQNAIEEGKALKDSIPDFFLESKPYRLLYVTGQLIL